MKPSRIGLAEKIRDIDEGNGCEIPNAWRVQSLGSVSFSNVATMNCGLADPLNDWLENHVQRAARKNFGEDVVSIDVAASFACRCRSVSPSLRMRLPSVAISLCTLSRSASAASIV